MVCWAISHFWVFVFNPYGFFISSTRAVNSFFYFLFWLYRILCGGAYSAKKKELKNKQRVEERRRKEGEKAKQVPFVLQCYYFFF